MKRVENDLLVNGPVVVDAFGAGKHGHTDGDPNVPQDGTRVMAEFMDHLQEEGCSMLERNGVGVDPSDKNQIGKLLARVGDLVYGNGSDGSPAVAASATISLSADTYAEDVTIGDNGELRLNGYRLFVRGTLTMGAGAAITADGGDGQAAGADRYDTGGPNFLEPGTTGEIGTVNAGTNGSNGGNTIVGGSAGDGGAGLQPAGLGGTSSTLSASAGGFRAYPEAVTTVSVGSVTRRIGAGAAGGSGGGDGVNPGGHSGAGGGVGVVCAKVIDMDATARISANGGAGADGSGGDTGGGGGGQGGHFTLVYRTVANGDLSTQVTASGGAGGAGVGTGANGSDGDDGAVLLLTA